MGQKDSPAAWLRRQAAIERAQLVTAKERDFSRRLSGLRELRVNKSDRLTPAEIPLLP